MDAVLNKKDQASQPVLELKGIGKRFPGVVALDGVNLEVFPQEVVALIGENGAGKSTLMKIIGGVYQPDAGELLINGEKVVIKSVADAIRFGVAFIHQELNVHANLDVGSNVYLGREPLWGGPLKLIDRQKIHSDTHTYLKRLGLDISSRTPLSQLSIAQQQMVEIAKALSQNARILIMDEPTSSLTLSETERLLDVVRDLREHGVSVIYISHRLSEVSAIADRVVALRDGRNAGSLAQTEITHDRMVNLMIGRDLSNFYVQANAERQPGYFQVKGLRTERYPGRTVSFEMSKGEILGFAGLVGAGRSEVAQTIFGVDKRLEGLVAIEGKPIKISSPKDAISAGIYLIPEDRRRCGLVTAMTVRENSTLPALGQYAPAGLIQKKQERVAATDLCEKLRVKTPSVEARIAGLSGGNQQKVVLGKWLQLKPRVMIFDEPTRGIDIGAKAEIYDLIRKLAESGVAVMMISSDMEEILNVCDRIAVMHEGSITGILEREQCSEEAIMRLAVGRT